MGPRPGSCRSRRVFLGTLLGAAALIAGCASPPSAAPLAAPTSPPATPTANPLAFLLDPTPTATPLPPTPSPTPIPPLVTAPPVRLLIPKIKVDAPIIPVGVLPDGAMEAPVGPVNVGWYRASPHPGEPGNALLTGHLDWHTDLGVFWRLRDLKAGDQILVRAQNGRTTPFAVEWSTVYPKDHAPLAEIFGFALGVVVTIITCDGTFIRNVRDYDHRRVVRARNR